MVTEVGDGPDEGHDGFDEEFCLDALGEKAAFTAAVRHRAYL